MEIALGLGFSLFLLVALNEVGQCFYFSGFELQALALVTRRRCKALR